MSLKTPGATEGVLCSWVSAAAWGLPGQPMCVPCATPGGCLGDMPRPPFHTPTTPAQRRSLPVPRVFQPFLLPKNEVKIEDNEMEMHILRTRRQPPGMQSMLLLLGIVKM